MTFSSWIRSWKRSIERRWALHQALRRKAVARRLATRPHLEILEDRWLLSAYVVTSTADSGTGSLRDAINSANNTSSGITEIDFNIGTKGTSSGVQTISPATPLPALTASAVFINGYSENQWQGVASTAPLIELNGTAITGDGLQLSGTNNSVSGLIIESFTDGIEVDGANNTIGGTVAGAGNVISGNTKDGVFIDASGVAVQGNYIGTDVTGTQANANSIGIEVGGSNCTIGGTTSGARNVISGNSYKGVDIPQFASGVQVQGNYIGTNAAGSAAVANNKASVFGQEGIDVVGSNCTIGGTSSGARNVISGNISDGVDIDAGGIGVAVEGNYIGTDVTGAYAVANPVLGVVVDAYDDTIGGTTSGARNIISGNGSWGVLILTPDVVVQGNYIGTNAAGNAALANRVGIELAYSNNNNTIGGTASGAGNVISGNSADGVVLDYAASGVAVQGNFIGTDAAGSAALANSVGIEVAGNNNSIGGTASGARNVISGNSADGVLIDNGVSGVQVQGNFVGANAAGNAALANTFYGIDINGSGNTVGGTASGARNVISGNSRDGVLIDIGISGVQVQGNFIGTNAAGNAALANSDNGVEVGGPNNTVGGTISGARNLISGNSAEGVLIDNTASGVAVQGNYIGTDVTGAKAIANGDGIFVSGSNTTIGGTTSGAGNIISGNSGYGVDISNSATLVQGNYIGTDATGTKAIANGTGVFVGTSDVTIGGTTTAARNIISGNADQGVYLLYDASDVQVQGNYIGTDVTGTKALANYDGINAGGIDNTIGGTVAGAGNIISGNSGAGVFLGGSGDASVQIQGNYIGTDATGTKAIANRFGVYVESSYDTIGGTTTGARNIISGNREDGVFLVASDETVQGNYIGTDVSGANALANSVGIEVDGSVNIGGTTTGAGNIISGNTNAGVHIDIVSGVQVQGNYIGTNAAGNAALANSVGVEVDDSNNTIGGTTSGARNVISGNSADGVLIDFGASGVQVQGNFIGTDVTGAKAVANGGGVWLTSSNNTIGGTTSGARNVISGNSVDGVLIDNGASGVAVQGNYIGTDAAGNAALANSVGVEVASSNNTIGGTTGGAGNVISGNSADGVLIDNGASGVAVQGNYIGTNAAGSAALANSVGIEVAAYSSNNTIGGITGGALNVISGNSADGVLIDSGASGVAVQGNYIGTNATGTIAIANRIGVSIIGSGNIIGGTNGGASNLISGNSTDGVQIAGSGNQVLGNYIGTNAAGKVALANGVGIEVDGNSNTVGGSTSGAGNLVSGNNGDGVLIKGSGNQVLGNYIGTNAAGNGALANSGNGVEAAGSNNTIGGTISGARNIISGNTGWGVLIDSTASGVAVQGNYIGTDVTGANAVANTVGVGVGGSNNTIGGTTSGARNIISGNTDGGVGIDASGVAVQGNYIGTDVAGTKALANGIGVGVGGSNNTIGGTTSQARNIISGNSGGGVLINDSATGVAVQGNYIGTDVTGAKAIANNVGIEVESSNNVIGGTISGAGNVISGNTGNGVFVGAAGVQVQGNYIGTDVTGAYAVANSIGIEVESSNNTIGGTTSGARNIISGNSSYGVRLDTSEATGVAVQGNYIGTNVLGTALGNGGYGVSIAGSDNTIGGSVASAGNSIAYNSSGGVLVRTGSGDTIRLNSISANGSTHTGPGITLSSGANNNLAAPTLHDARLHDSTLTVHGSFTAPTAHVSYVLDFFANVAGDAEGKIYLGSLAETPTRTGNIPFTFTTTTTATGTYPLITAMLTDASGDTSSFSTGVTVSSPPPSSPPSSPPLPTLNVPPLLAFINSLFGGGTETVNSNGTETIVDTLFGIPLLVSTYNSSGNLVSVALFGMNLTLLFE